tara:strand:+ start:873 stop:1157 length:285 start_codon:yes stop_codon:yes gene_type:complete
MNERVIVIDDYVAVSNYLSALANGETDKANSLLTLDDKMFYQRELGGGTINQNTLAKLRDLILNQSTILQCNDNWSLNTCSSPETLFFDFTDQR